MCRRRWHMHCPAWHGPWSPSARRWLLARPPAAAALSSPCDQPGAHTAGGSNHVCAHSRTDQRVRLCRARQQQMSTSILTTRMHDSHAQPANLQLRQSHATQRLFTSTSSPTSSSCTPLCMATPHPKEASNNHTARQRTSAATSSSVGVRPRRCMSSASFLRIKRRSANTFLGTVTGLTCRAACQTLVQHYDA